MRTILLAALLLALPLLPPAAAAPPVASFGATLDVDTRWGYPGFTTVCYASPAVLVAEHVNSRVLLSMHSTHHVATNAQVPYTETRCSVSFVLEPGLTVNPCDMPRGTPSPALTTSDPYFHEDPSGDSHDSWSKRVDFANGGYLELFYVEHFGPSSIDGSFYGECVSGDVWARFEAFFDRTSVG